jgi:hypothetical protein
VKRLKTQYRVDKDLFCDKECGIENLKNIVWMNILLKKKIGDYVIFASIEGGVDNKSIRFYSKPELTENEIYDLLKKNGIFSFMDTEDYKEKIIGFLKLEKNFLEKFTRGFHIDDIDFSKNESGINLDIKKEIGKNLNLNYGKNIYGNSSDTLGFEYKLKNNLTLEGNMFIDSNNDLDGGSSLKLKWKTNF